MISSSRCHRSHTSIISGLNISCHTGLTHQSFRQVDVTGLTHESFRQVDVTRLTHESFRQVDVIRLTHESLLLVSHMNHFVK